MYLWGVLQVLLHRILKEQPIVSVAEALFFFNITCIEI